MTGQEKDTILASIDQLPGSFLITDPTGVVLYANKGIESRTGFSVSEVVGKKPGKLWGGGMDRSFYNEMWDSIEVEKKPFVGIVKNTKKGGKLQKEELHIAPIKNKSGGVEYFIEAHPLLKKKKDVESFRSEFLTVCSQGKLTQYEFLDWMLPWLSQGATGSKDIRETAKRLKGYVQDVSTGMNQLFVLPMRERFASRHDDHMLILAAKERPDEFKKLYIKYYRVVHAYFKRRLGTYHTGADDLAQETFYRAFKYLDNFQLTNASYKTYLLRIAHNQLANYYRKKREISLGDDESLELSYEDNHEQLWTADVIRKAMFFLSKAEQDIVRMKHLEGFSIREIAVGFGKTENAIKLILSRARKKMRVHIK
jgi:RNA polymerase sigma-70 factor, ECF subfamily